MSDTITVWFMDDGTRLDDREYSPDNEHSKIHAKRLAEKYNRPVEVYEVQHVTTQYPERLMETCINCGYKWPYAKEGVDCPKCGEDNLPF